MTKPTNQSPPPSPPPPPNRLPPPEPQWQISTEDFKVPLPNNRKILNEDRKG